MALSRLLVAEKRLRDLLSKFKPANNRQVDLIFNKDVPENGVVFTFYSSGLPRSQTLYADGVAHGTQRFWGPNEKLSRLAEFANGIPHGSHLWYSRTGNLEQEIRFSKGVAIYEARYDEKGLRYLENFFKSSR